MYEPIIGLEIHVELKTRTKMFCGCLNDIEEKRPNVNICPVCTGHPGTLPVINQKAVESVIKVGLALSGSINPSTKFDRKNYFYPDIPKAFQISQYDKPLVEGGYLEIKDEKLGIDKKVRITRIHLEEDTARMSHVKEDGKDVSLVDFNRSGLPLMELVTEPDIRSAAEARLFAEELRTILRYLQVSDADMEKGEMRIEPNISLRKPGTNELPDYKTELKNINSFRHVELATEYEIERQEELLKARKRIPQETRGWREDKGVTESQRSKEEAHDYRYFPEPDLPPLQITSEQLEKLRIEIPELPNEKMERFKREFALSGEQAYFLTRDPLLAEYYENAVSELSADIDAAARQQGLSLLYNYISSDVRGLMNELGIEMIDLKIKPEDMADVVEMIIKGEITSRIAKDLLREMIQTGGDPREIVKDKGMQQVSDEGAIGEVAKKVIEANPKSVADYKSGKTNALMFLVGQCMRELKGKGNPEKIKEQLLKELS